MKKIAVIFSHYQLPSSRLALHFVWNADVYRKYNVRVFVVADRIYPMPDYARCCVYPKPLKIFSIAKTSNYGIRKACDNGFEIIVKTDVDCVFSETLMALIESTNQHEGIAPEYRMANDFAQTIRAPENIPAWPDTKGTLALPAWVWRDICGYNENLEGYGIEDGDCYERATRSRIKIIRAAHAPLWHIAHEAGTLQARGPRIDFWNRENGFNPKNHSYNRQARKGKLANPNWGIV